MLPQTATALQISEHLLDLTGQAMMNGDLHSFQTSFSYPFEIETENGKQTFRNADEIASIFQALHDHLKQMRVTIFARHCVAAEFRTLTEIVSTHETRLISDGLLIEDPFPTMSVLVRDDAGAWRVRSSSYFVPDDSLYRAVLDP